MKNRPLTRVNLDKAIAHLAQEDPTVTKMDGWDEIYANQKLNLPVLPTVDDAIVWTNELIAKINAARM